MKKLLLTCGVVALLSGASAYAQAAPNQLPNENFTPGPAAVGAVQNLPTITFPQADPANPVQVEIDFGPTSLFAVATEDKDVITNELITFNTFVDLNQIVDNTHADDFAEASAMGVQQNSNNKDCSNCAEKSDIIGGPTPADGSGNNNTGLISINQAGGNMNNQGTLVSAAIDSTTVPPVTPPPPPTPTPPTGTPATGGGFAHAQAEATQTNGAFATGEAAGNDVEAVDLITRLANIDNSFNHDTGLVYANQATGNNNNQLNELALAFSERPQGVAIAESDLGQFNTDNTVGESASVEAHAANENTGINKTAEITDSLNNDTGLFGVNQAVGNNGNQANIVSVAAIGTNLPSF
jgi:hypothetical protein